MCTRLRGLVFALGTVVLTAQLGDANDRKQAVNLKASDGVTVYGVYYAAAAKSAPIILLFHQAGSNHAEYDPIASRLVKDGFAALAIDQRAGGSKFGSENLTVQHAGHNGEYLDALKDLEAAVAWAKSSGRGDKILVWGSSYSASLVFLLAAGHPEIAGVLAFSPGEYFDDKEMVRRAAVQVHVPVFVTSSAAEQEVSGARAVLEAVQSSKKTQFIPRSGEGVHGSSTLRTDRNPKGAEANWKAVENFLAAFH